MSETFLPSSFELMLLASLVVLLVFCGFDISRIPKRYKFLYYKCLYKIKCEFENHIKNSVY